jgi:hypothetical protein
MVSGEPLKIAVSILYFTDDPRSNLRVLEALRYRVLMNLPKRTIATTELLLIFPAALFMTALFVRNL